MFYSACRYRYYDIAGGYKNVKNSNYYPETCFAIYWATIRCIFLLTFISASQKTALPTVLTFCEILHSSEGYFQKNCIFNNNCIFSLYCTFKTIKKFVIHFIQFQSFPRRYFENDSHKATFLDHFLDGSQNIAKKCVSALSWTATMMNNLFNTLFNEIECNTGDMIGI